MTLARTALRLATIEALRPHALLGAASPAWPTCAQHRVIDSVMEPVDLKPADARLPLIAVFADEAKRDPRGGAQDVMAAGEGGERVILACEIMVPMSVPAPGGGAQQVVAETDAAAEAVLDLIEEQIRQRLAEARMHGPLRHVLSRIGAIESRPYRDAETDRRLSARRIEFDCEIRESEPWPVDETELAALPEPLRGVALALPDGSYGRRNALLIAALRGDPALIPALDELRLAGNLARGHGDAPADPPDAGGTTPSGDVAGTVIP